MICNKCKLNVDTQQVLCIDCVKHFSRSITQAFFLEMQQGALATKEILDGDISDMLTGKINELENCCEHGDHLAMPGMRFCSPECMACESESLNGCDGMCEVKDGK